MSWIASFFGSIALFLSSLLGIHPVDSPAVTIPVAQVASSTKPISTKTGKIAPVSKSMQLAWVSPASHNPVYSIVNDKVYVKTGDGLTEVSGADAATFLVPDDSNASKLSDSRLAYRYAKDKNTVYYRTLTDGSLIPESDKDVATFVVVDGGDGYDSQDKNHKYFAGSIACEDTSKMTRYLYDGPGTGNGRWYQDSRAQ